MRKSRISFRLPEALIEALEKRADLEGQSTVKVALNILESGLGISSTGDTSVCITTTDRSGGLTVGVVTSEE